MTHVDALVALGRMQQIQLAYALAFDTKDLDGVLAVFTSDATWVSPYSGACAGSDALTELFRSSFAAVDRCAHVVGQSLLTSFDGDRARCSTYFQSEVVYDGEPTTLCSDVGYYDDDLVRLDDAWRIERRTVNLLLPSRRSDFTLMELPVLDS